MDKRISDMLGCLDIDSIELHGADIASVEKIKEAAMNKIYSNNTTHKRKSIRIAAVAVAAVMLLSAGVFAADHFGLVQLRAPVEVADEPSIGLNGLQGDTQYTAAAEWAVMINDWYEAGENVLTPEQETDVYTDYGAHSTDAREALDTLAAKYGLKLHERCEYFSAAAQLYEAVGAEDFLPGEGTGRDYGDGSFVFKSKGGDIFYEVYANGKDYFNRGHYMLERGLENAQEWTYTTPEGVELLLVLGEYKSVIAADMSDSFIFVNLRSGSSNNGSGSDAADSAKDVPTLDRAALEAWAESFGFAQMNELSK